jgi:hypothetical protein
MNHAEDRIGQGRFFLQKAEEVGSSDPIAFRYFLEASIVAARSVTFLLQSQYRDRPQFNVWYATIQNKLRADPLARYLLEKRNFVLKEGTLKMRKVITLTIHQAVEVDEALRIRVIGGSWRSRIRNRLADLRYVLKQYCADLLCKFRSPPKNANRESAEISETFFFQETEWSKTPATDLLEQQFNSLEMVVNQCNKQFGEPTSGTNGG